MNAVPVMFIEFPAYRFEYTDDVADRTVIVLHAHIDDAAVIRNSVKLSVHPDAAF